MDNEVQFNSTVRHAFMSKSEPPDTLVNNTLVKDNTTDIEEEEVKLSYQASIEHLVDCMEVYEKVKNDKDEVNELKDHIYQYVFKYYLIDLMCNFKDFLDLVEKRDQIQTINFIYYLFNDELYKECLRLLNQKKNHPYLLYGILVMEYWKQYLLDQISKSLVADTSKSKVKSKINIRNKIINTQCLKNINYSSKLVKEYYEIAKIHSRITKEELDACTDLMNLLFQDDNDLSIKKSGTYEIEIVIEK